MVMNIFVIILRGAKICDRDSYGDSVGVSVGKFEWSSSKFSS